MNENYFDLGDYARPITTDSREAQGWFDRGLLWCYGFNHEEGAACFERAAGTDPGCAMAHWGMAFARGPFINLPWEFFSSAELETTIARCYETSQQAISLSKGTSPVERALIEAQGMQFQSAQTTGLEQLKHWGEEYAAAMRAVHKSFPEDPDVVALFGESMMNRTPWKLWDIHTGTPLDGADTLEMRRVLEDGMRVRNARGLSPHPGMLHMYIHTMEMSPVPEAALEAADRLHLLSPDNGHLNHMPSHIYVQCGRYADALAVSEKAVAADKKFLDYAGPYNFYTTARCHDLHLMMYAAMLCGRYRTAIRAADEIIETLSPDVLLCGTPHAIITMEGYYSMKMHALVRFGKWQTIIESPLPADPELYQVTTGMYRYAKGVAHAASGNIAEALTEKELFLDACDSIDPDRFFFNNAARDVLAIAGEMLDGELDYRRGEYDSAFAHLRQAVYLDDHLHYTEPWAWMHPPRHALGALLLEQDRVAEAELVYREDLGLDGTLARCAWHPDNVWSLHGYTECLLKLGKREVAREWQDRLRLALQIADVDISSSCCCRSKLS